MNRRPYVMGGLLALFVATAAVHAPAQLGGVNLQIARPTESNGWMRLSSSLRTNTVLTLSATANFNSWDSIATLHDALFQYPDAATPSHAQRFYRLNVRQRQADDDWKNQILFPTERFRSPTATPNVRWVKFAIPLNDPVRVFYQDSTEFPFHYDFATQRLPPFIGMDHASFNAISLYRTNQQVVLGTVLYAPFTNVFEYGVQFVGLDVYSPEQIERWFELVRATVYASNGGAAYYMPSFEQAEMTRTNAEDFAARGIPIAYLERWVTINHIYSAGWALGRLKYFPAAEIDEAFADGRLRPEDILLTDGVPAETPLVAGIISLTPSTPNSHVAILSQSFGIPFVHLPDAEDRARVQQLVGRKIILRATVINEFSQVKVIDVDNIDAGTESELLALKRPRPIQFRPKQSFGAINASTDTLVPPDIQYFGGKAANYGLLRRAIPTNCPPAIALSFDLWDAFLDQTLAGGQTLRNHIATRLAPYTNYPPNIAALKADLAAIRDLIRRTARFTPAQQQAITNVLRVFTPGRNIRFRSSTNVEDSEHFTGAGLYDSFSGCLLDDLDADTQGPSHCDPTEDEERGVFRAIQRVYASFYNDNAFLERLRHGVNESHVAMGVLVHHSFPDAEEMANGVADMRFRWGNSFVTMSGDLVTQLGAESVTNPDGSASPEVVRASYFTSGGSVTLHQSSSRVPLGAYVMNWDDDYEGFAELFKSVGGVFRSVYTNKIVFFLDFEYKKDTNLGLVVKQVREIPNPNTTNRTVAFTINEPTLWCVAQQELGNAFANHRLKSLWTLHTHNMSLTESNRAQGIYTEAVVNYIEDDTVQTLSGPMGFWTNYTNNSSGDLYSWTTGSGAGQRSWTLDTLLTTEVSGSQPPIFTQDDFRKSVTVTYATPVATINDGRYPTNTTSEMVVLVRCPELKLDAILQERSLIKTNVINIQTSYYWPRPPGISAGYTAPLVKWVETRITGLTTDPIVLTNYFSQTYHPFHHNFMEEFIFEPRLEPGLPSSTLAELVAADIQLIHVFRGSGAERIFSVMGFDGKIRRL